MSSYIRKLCGECKHFLPDRFRSPVDWGGITRSIHYGTCELSGERYDRCRFCDDCPHMLFDRRKAQSAPGMALLGPKTRGNWTQRKLMRLDTHATYKSVSEAARLNGIRTSTMNSALKNSLKFDRNYFVTNGVHFLILGK